MWAVGMSVGFVAFVVGAVLSFLAFMDASGLDGMLPGIVLAAVGCVMFWGFLVWRLALRRRTSEE
jgi:hypothetical protein